MEERSEHRKETPVFKLFIFLKMYDFISRKNGGMVKESQNGVIYLDAGEKELTGSLGSKLHLGRLDQNLNINCSNNI